MQRIEIIIHGTPSIEILSNEEQKAFYGTLLARILSIYAEKRKEEQ